ncbi:cytoplasmic incompatibility factor CifB [Wolbachia endosymbiont of Drosophila nikananu]|nr:cytoplasmic incompatibility factor CifB [Wolbachia endosymbiont of Drosophila nikananu]MDE5060921.1 cytoplasmic incompatibility factor CifB [Wolbachia endosymbiont of Drosophila nikananu]MDE5060926.1 cytoplasmic incompatibility factor CifB [Wolbachia endosymbiont of Drosophila nikananu]MDE5061090.1 cytoplasmic incompatibility factor CifB [Wolbachia endosymbiont of Drosophila nikananu]
MDGDLDGFRQEFESFLDQCPSFLYHVGTGRFLPVFFFSMFATAHDAGILNTDEKVYFRFDNHGIDTGGRNRNTGNLKVVILTRNRDGQQVVRCYSISDRPNSDGLRFSEREKDSLVQEIIQQNQGLREEDLSFEQYKVCMHGKGRSQGEAIATVFEVIREKDSQGRDRFAKYSASEISLLRHIERNRLRGINAPAPRSVLTVKEIGSIRLNQDQRVQLGHLVNFVQAAPGQQGIFNFMEVLASNQRINVERGINEGILPYITRIYRNYLGSLQNDIQNRSQKFESYGFLLGFLANFSHRYTIGIDLDLSPRNSHVAFLVRHQEERGNVPIVINIATGATLSSTALDCARGHAKRLYVSSFIPIHTTSEHTVCFGLNFDLNRIPFRVDTVGLQQDRFPLVQRLFECLENEEIRENIRDFLLQHLPAEIPRNAENYNRIFDCITGFTFGSSAFAREYLELEEGEDRVRVRKYIFRYGDGDLRRHTLTMVFYAQGYNIVTLHIRAHDAQQQEAIDLQALNVNRNNVHIWEVSCTLNDQFELDIDQPNDLGLYHDYQNNNANNFLAGDLIQVPNVENVHGISERVMNDGWKNVGQHRELFQEISGILMPLRDAINVNSEGKFRSILHGTFYASDNPYKVLAMYKVGQTYSLKRGQEEEGERVILTRITEQTLDLLLLRQPTENDLDTHPIGYILRFAGNVEEVAQKENNAKDRIKELMNKQRGYLLITSGNEAVLFPLIFNAGAGRVEGLISIPEGIGREEYVHKLDRGGRDLRSGGLVGPESVIDENPPEGLLSDQTRENLINYIRENPGRNQILPFDLGDNRCVSITTFEGSIQQLLEILRSRIMGGDNAIPTAQGIRRQIRDILGNQGIEVNDLLTLEFATRNGHYDYWLQQIDIAHAGRLQYQLRTEGNHTFEAANLARNDGNEHIVRVLNQFRENEEQQRLTLIITLNNTHWVTLVIERQNGNYVGYYADSTATAVPGGITDIIQNNLGNNIRINNVSVRQQTDGWNCGLWALENAKDINRVLNENPGEQVQNVVNIMRDFLERNHPNRDRNYFQNIRVGISQLFRNDPGFQDVQLQAYIQNREQIDPLLRTYLELGYHRVGGGCGPVEAPISLSVSDSSNFGGLPQSSLESPEASVFLTLAKVKAVGRGNR